MDDPTSEKSPLAKAVENEFKSSRKQGQEDSIRLIKPVFDKMLALLKGIYYGEIDPYEDPLLRGGDGLIEKTIKEAEELGL